MKVASSLGEVKKTARVFEALASVTCFCYPVRVDGNLLDVWEQQFCLDYVLVASLASE